MLLPVPPSDQTDLELRSSKVVMDTVQSEEEYRTGLRADGRQSRLRSSLCTLYLF